MKAGKFGLELEICFFLELRFSWIGDEDSCGEVCLFSIVKGGICFPRSFKTSLGGWESGGEVCLSSMVAWVFGGMICLSCSSTSLIGGWDSARDSKAKFCLSSMSISFGSEGGDNSSGGTREGEGDLIGGMGSGTPSVEFFSLLEFSWMVSIS